MGNKRKENKLKKKNGVITCQSIGIDQKYKI
jgi:hypothetical protein